MNFVVDYKINNLMCAPNLSSVTLDGEIGARFDRFIDERVAGRFAVEEILKEAEKCFFDQLDDEFNYGLWRSEFWGKLMLSAVRVSRMKSDANLRAAIRDSVYRILSYQREDGYLSAYRNSDHIFPVDKKISLLQVEWECDYSWNVWGQKYTLWALLEAAMLLDDRAVLDACVRLLDRLILQIEKSGKRVKDTGVMHGLASSSILKPTLVLYRLTGDEKYLAFSKRIAEDMDSDKDEWPNVIKNAFSGVPVSKWYKTEDGWYAKAYEMMSTVDGIIELYRVTGEKRYLDAPMAYWELLSKYEVNILGSAGYCERLSDAKEYVDSATEVCDAIHWMRISYELFSLTGEEKYVSAFEKAFLNAFLAGVFDDGRGGAFFVRSAGRHWNAEPQVGTKYQNCCLNNVPRGFANAAEIVASRDAEGYSLNMCIPATLRFGNTLIHIHGGYVDNGVFFVTVRGAVPGEKIKIRIPAWTNSATVRLGLADDITVTGGGRYEAFTLTEEDTLIKIAFDMTARIVDFEGSYVDLPDTDYHRKRWVDTADGLCDRGAMVFGPMSTLTRGPLLFARSKRMLAKEEDMFSGKTVFGTGATCEAKVIRHDRMLSAIKVKISSDGEERELLMCDFASAANRELDDPRYFTVFI